jgi:DNA-binding transcriptional ArsR family regulator
MAHETSERVVERLDILIELLIPRYDEAKYNVSGIALEVLKYCDAAHTVNDITQRVKKPKNAVEKTLSKLRSLELIKSVIKDGRILYIRRT